MSKNKLGKAVPQVPILIKQEVFASEPRDGSDSNERATQPPQHEMLTGDRRMNFRNCVRSIDGIINKVLEYQKLDKDESRLKDLVEKAGQMEAGVFDDFIKEPNFAQMPRLKKLKDFKHEMKIEESYSEYIASNIDLKDVEKTRIKTTERQIKPDYTACDWTYDDPSSSPTALSSSLNIQTFTKGAQKVGSGTEETADKMLEEDQANGNGRATVDQATDASKFIGLSFNNLSLEAAVQNIVPRLTPEENDFICNQLRRNGSSLRFLVPIAQKIGSLDPANNYIITGEDVTELRSIFINILTLYNQEKSKEMEIRGRTAGFLRHHDAINRRNLAEIKRLNAAANFGIRVGHQMNKNFNEAHRIHVAHVGKLRRENLALKLHYEEEKYRLKQWYKRCLNEQESKWKKEIEDLKRQSSSKEEPEVKRSKED